MTPLDKPILSAERLAEYRTFEQTVRKDMEQLHISGSSCGGVLLLRIRHAINELHWLINDRPDSFHKFDSREHQRRYPPKQPFPPRFPRRQK